MLDDANRCAARVLSASCARCGAGTVAVRHTRPLPSGRFMEERSYGCGRTMRLDPLLGAEQEVDECAVTPDIAKRSALRAQLLQIIEAADVDPQFKAELADCLPAATLAW